MSGAAPTPGRRTLLISLIMTACLAAAAYYVWIYANIGARTFARGTLLTDLRFFVGLLAVFLALSFLDRFIAFAQSKLDRRR